MVGKIRHVRQKIHQEAVKLERPSGLTESAISLFQTEKPLSAEQQSSVENQKTDPAKNGKKVSKSYVCVNIWQRMQFLMILEIQLDQNISLQTYTSQRVCCIFTLTTLK